MNKSVDKIALKLDKLVQKAMEIRNAYLNGQIINALESIDDLTDIIENVETSMNNLPDPSFNLDDYSKPKNSDLALKPKTFNR